jgi:DNA-binding CsgD family transcriptional regulator
MRSAEDGLTLRQREIIVMLAEGKSNKEIAREFKVLEGTVKLHVKGILRKLGVRNRTEAVVVAARRGYLPKGILGIEGTVSRAAANVDGELAGALTPSPQSGARSQSPGDASCLRRPEPPRSQKTAVTKAPSGKVLLGSTDNDQADAIAPSKATNIVSLSPKKSKPA